MAWETVMRTRFSKGYRISNFITPTLISNGDLMILSTIDSDQAFALQIECISSNTEANKNQDSNSIKSYNDDNPEPFLHIQSAVLYTHGDGTRRIRVHNACLPIVNRLIDVFEGIDAECLSTFFLKSTIDKIFKTKKMSNSILQFSSMAKNMMSAALSAQQSLKKEVPENLIPLILYILGSLKNRVLCKDEIERKLDIDLSNYMRIKLQKLSTFDVQSFIYPRIYPLQSVLENPNIGVFNEDNSLCELPQVRFIFI
jgi:protein transport protein SEC24